MKLNSIVHFFVSRHAVLHDAPLDYGAIHQAACQQYIATGVESSLCDSAVVPNVAAPFELPLATTTHDAA